MPIFKVWWPDRGQKKEDATTVKAFDHEHAAKVWADWYDAHSAEYPIVGGEVAEVMVLHEGCECPDLIKVRGFQSREYTASAA